MKINLDKPPINSPAISPQGNASYPYQAWFSDIYQFVKNIDYQPVLPIAAHGWLHNDGSNVLTWTTPTAVEVGADPTGSAATVQTNLSTHEALTTTAHGGLLPSTTGVSENTIAMGGPLGVGLVDTDITQVSGEVNINSNVEIEGDLYVPGSAKLLKFVSDDGGASVKLQRRATIGASWVDTGNQWS